MPIQKSLITTSRGCIFAILLTLFSFCDLHAQLTWHLSDFYSVNPSYPGATDGIHASPNDNINDNLAFQQAATAIEDNDNQDDITLIIDAPVVTGGHWIVGVESHTESASDAYYLCEDIFDLTGRTRSLIITGEGTNAPIIRMADNMHLGLFGFHGEKPPTPDAWNFIGTSYGCQNLADYINSVNNPNPVSFSCPADYVAIQNYAGSHLTAWPKWIFHLTNCSNITINNLEMDGNSDHFILGGERSKGSHPYELHSDGITAGNVTQLTLTNLNIHDMGGDGFGLFNPIPAPYDNSNDGIFIQYCKFNYNGRNGISWTSGKGFHMSASEANYNGTKRIKSDPGAGIDIEPEAPAFACMNGIFEKCHFMGNQNSGAAMPVNSYTQSYCGNHSFTDCEFGNCATQLATNVYAALVKQRACNFTGCQFYGLTTAVYAPQSHVSYDDAQKFTGCLFTDCYGGNIIRGYPLYTVLIDSKNAQIDSCTFKTYDQEKNWNMYCGHDYIGSDMADRMNFNNCTFIKYNCRYGPTNTEPNEGFIFHANITNSKFYLNRYNSADGHVYYFYFTDVTGVGNTTDWDVPVPLCEIDCARPGAPVITADPDIVQNGVYTICPGDHLQLSGNPGGGTWVPIGGTGATTDITQTGDYYLTVPGECSTPANSNHISVIVNPLPEAAVISADHPITDNTVTICEGESVILTTSIIGTWNVNSNTSTQLTVTESGYYSLTTANDCGTTPSLNTIHVIVNSPGPVPIISPSGPTTFCSGGSVILTSSAASGNQWYMDGSSLSGQTGTTLTATASGDYYVTVTNANGCSITSATTTVTVNSNPSTPTISANGPTTFCSGGSVILTSSASNSYQWNLNGLPVPGQTNQSITVSASGNYSVTVSNLNGCSATSTPTTVTVNSNPSTPTISANGPTTFCSGGSVILTSSASNGYQWNLNGVPASGQTNQSITLSASGNYSIIVTNTAGCTATSAATTVTVNPTFSYSTLSGPSNICSYLDDQHTATYSITTTGATAYSWTKPANAHWVGGTPTGNTAQVWFETPIGTPNYVGVIVTSNGCGSSSSGLVKQYLAATAPTNTPGTLVPAGTAVNPCLYPNSANPITLSFSPNVTNATEYTWTIPNEATFVLPSGITGNTYTGSSTSVQIYFNVSTIPTTSTVSVYGLNGCGNGPARSITFTKAIPTAPAISGPAHPCGGDNVTYSVTQQTAAASYSWSVVPSSAVISYPNWPQTNVITVAFPAGSSPTSVSVYGQNACGQSGTTTKNLSCQIGRIPVIPVDPKVIPEISVYPNPSNGDFKIQLEKKKGISTADLTITNQFGETIYKAKEKCSSGIINLNLKNKLVSGVYLVTCIIDGKKTSKKIVIYN